ncbi:MULTISPECIES: glycoside hydrolase family 18 protein [unclassified Microcoleus]|uniref:glycoside hydrolase family 18 protein n=1 Tax=unclassified Microcoleus TaxID=2642155 RepID=UPI002FCECBB9
MGISTDYSNVPDWVAKPEGYPTGSMVKYNGNIFYANFWASEPGVGDADHNGWRFYDELYDQTPHTPTAQAKIIAYIPTWRKKEGFNYANDEMYRYITHGIVSFLMFSEVNLGEFEPKSLDDVKAILSDVVNTGHRNGTRILIALGGAVDYGFLKLMTDIGNNPDNPLLDRAVQNVVNFVNSNHLDGVDLDLECWWGKPGEQDQGGRPKGDGPHPAGSALTLFAQKLKQAIPDKLVSAAIFGTSYYGNNYDPKLADYVDWLGIMTYDLTGSWNASPVGPHTTLYKIRNQESSNIRTQDSYQESYVEEQQGEWPNRGIVNNPILSVEDTLWYWTNPLFVNWQGAGQNIPRDKIAAGVPIYGYDFAYGKDPDDLSGQVPPGYKSIRYKDILAQFPDAHTAANGNIKVLGSTPRPPFISASGDYLYTHNIYFETPETAVTKLNFLKDVGAQGVIIWELSNDVWEEGKSIIKALYQNSGNPETRPALPSSRKTPVPSDILTPLIERIGSYTNEFAAEIAQGKEKETSRLGFLVEPTLVEAISQFFDEAGKTEGEEIPKDDKDRIIGLWIEIEESAKRYRVNSPDALSVLTELKGKVAVLVGLVASMIGGMAGWLSVPFFSMITLFQTHILLEGFVRQNPSEGRDVDTDNDDEKQKECEREADEVSQQIQRAIDVLKGALDKWPTKDLGDIGSVLGIPTPTKPDEPDAPTQPPKTPIRLPSTSIVNFANGLFNAALKDSPNGHRIISKKQEIIRNGVSAQVFTVYEIQSQEGCNMAMEALRELKEAETFLASFFLGPGGWILRLTRGLLAIADSNEDFNDLFGDWTYQVGDRLFVYGAAGGSWAHNEMLFVSKRNGQIYYQGDISEDLFPKFQEYFGINPLL